MARAKVARPEWLVWPLRRSPTSTPLPRAATAADVTRLLGDRACNACILPVASTEGEALRRLADAPLAACDYTAYRVAPGAERRALARLLHRAGALDALRNGHDDDEQREVLHALVAVVAAFRQAVRASSSSFSLSSSSSSSSCGVRVDLRLAVLHRTQCPRFHSDTVHLRAVCALAGAGTEVLRDEALDRAAFERMRRRDAAEGGGGDGDGRWSPLRRFAATDLARMSAAEHARRVTKRQWRRGVGGDVGGDNDDDDCNGSAEANSRAVERARTGEAVFLKGNAWPRNERRGAVHRSPETCAEMGAGRRRLLFQVDLSPDDDDEEEAKKEVVVQDGARRAM